MIVEGCGGDAVEKEGFLTLRTPFEMTWKSWQRTRYRIAEFGKTDGLARREARGASLRWNDGKFGCLPRWGRARL